MSKPKNIKPVMQAPERRNMVALAMLKRKQGKGAHADKRKGVDWKREQW